MLFTIDYKMIIKFKKNHNDKKNKNNKNVFK